MLIECKGIVQVNQTKFRLESRSPDSLSGVFIPPYDAVSTIRCILYSDCVVELPSKWGGINATNLSINIYLIWENGMTTYLNMGSDAVSTTAWEEKQK